MEGEKKKQILDGLEKVGREVPVFVAGGPVRDWLLGRDALDLDLVIPEDAIRCAGDFAARTGGRLVLLDEDEGIARVVFSDLTFDYSQYRGGAGTLEGDLAQRDFTINAMAVPLACALEILRAEPTVLNEGTDRKRRMPEMVREELIDPLGGLSDLENAIIRAIARGNLESDPLRLLRAHRFRAQLDFAIERMTGAWITELSDTIRKVAPERINHELHLIMASEQASRAVCEMADDALLFQILPELAPTAGVQQPGFHHLDVLGHSLATVREIENLLADGSKKFFPYGPIEEWVEDNRGKITGLKWAGLLHDVGKPESRGEKGERTTFYQHDQAGTEIVERLGRRLRWSRRETAFAAGLVRLHMRPFHLLNDLRRNGPTKRAMRRLLVEAGSDYPALFILAMGDSMAGCGPLKPPELDTELSLLWERVHGFYLNKLRPAATGPRLLTGHDIQEIFGLSPGPLIGEALEALVDAQVEGIIDSREEAAAWLSEWLGSRGSLYVSQP
jgi:poly(A) polymerase